LGAGGLLRPDSGRNRQAVSLRTSEKLVYLSGRVGFLNGLLFLSHYQEGAQQELRKVADGKSILALDSFASELSDEIGDKGNDFISGDERIDVVEQLGGQGFCIELG
jgi:hypothetical protein